MKTQKYLLRTNNENIESIKMLAKKNLTSMNQYLNSIIESHIKEARKSDINRKNN
ncbi:hypothetical protein H4684_003402 [Desulfomicrobium macestii]|uniref:Uncharacterized protein n=1 Tax=Desulfomicrobium macestii TaxID=90731 RepID=A0ABR9H7R3_9BACT|nr:hypothetical protein [Desulfomicrobium macestii]